MEKPHKRLNAWKESIHLFLLIYDLVNRLPKNEEYGLATQLRRAATSIPANIAEGTARQTRRMIDVDKIITGLIQALKKRA